MAPSKFRAFVFTINNWTDDDVARLHGLNYRYLVAGAEVAPTTGTRHLQGYVYLAAPRSFESIRKELSGAHVEVAKGTPQQASAYCKKDGEIIIEDGECPHQGARNDISHVRALVQATPKMRVVTEEAHSLQAMKVAETWLNYHEPERRWKPEVRWYHGPTGTGKTRTAVEWLGDGYYLHSFETYKWWQGYDGHECVLIDDIRPDWAKFHVMLKLLDRYPYRVETKGASRQFLARKIAITSPMPPEVMYHGVGEDMQQLLRRIDEVVYIGDAAAPQENNLCDMADDF